MMPDDITAKKSTMPVWRWVLLPIASMLLMAFLWWGAAAIELSWLNEFFFLIFFLQVLFAIVAWVFFGIRLRHHCHVAVMILLILLYPILQIVVQGSIFFGGCVSVIQETGVTFTHGAPDGYEDRYKDKEDEEETEPPKPEAQEPAPEPPTSEPNH